MKCCKPLLVLTVLCAAPVFGQTWLFDADLGQDFNAVGQPFEGGLVGGANATRSFIDLGGGDLVYQFNTIDPNTDAGSYFEQSNAPQWAPNNALGHTTEWKVRIDPVFGAEDGSADLIAGDNIATPVMRLTRAPGGPLRLRVQNIFGQNILEHRIGNPEAFHTYRMDVQGGTTSVYVDDYPWPVLVNNGTTANGFNFVRIGDGTGSGDGKHQTQFLSSYQNGLKAAPQAPNPMDPMCTLFLAHYDGNTGSGGLDADYAAGNPTAVGTGGLIDSGAKFGLGSLDGLTASGTVNYDTASNFNLPSGTIEMWVNADNWADSAFAGFFAASGGGGDIRMQKTSGNALQVYMAAGGEVWSLTSGALALDQEWHHLAWTWDFNANKSAIYLDGNVLTSAVSTSGGLPTINYLGAVNPTFEVGTIQNGSAAFNGLIDEFRISSKDLYGGQAFTPQNQPYIPEPASLLLLALGTVMLARRRN